MRCLPFFKYSPSGNMTILLEAELSPAERVAACNEVIHAAHLAAEQAGVIDLHGATPRLDMMGGEFCVNATRAFAALLAVRGKLIQGESGILTGSVVSSGAAHPLDIRVRSLDASHIEAAVRLNLQGTHIHMPKEGISIIHLPGIVHIILDEAIYPLPQGDATKLNSEAKYWREQFGLSEEPAVGTVRLQPVDMANGKYAITPHVWVRDTQSACMETACGSGSLAAALSLAAGKGSFSIRQPGGAWINIDLQQTEDGSMAAWIGGVVTLIAQGEVFLESLG